MNETTDTPEPRLTSFEGDASRREEVTDDETGAGGLLKEIGFAAVDTTIEAITAVLRHL